jgi:hypothetical protein
VKRDAKAAEERSDSVLLDASEGLAHEPRLLTDPQLLGALHAELAARQPRAAAARSLFQLGFLHGMRDSLRAAPALGEASRPGPSPTPAAPLLAIALEPRPRCAARGEVALLGSWPLAHEAAARTARLGSSEDPVCGLSGGYTAGWYSGLFERDLVAVERSCVARGDATCRFELREAQAWRERDDAQALSLLEDLPFQTYRDLAARSYAAVVPARLEAPAFHPSPPPRAGAEGDAPVVHVWGPVMVIPFSCADEALRGLDLIGRDPAAREVCVVVLDLTDAVLDEAFGAATLEHIVGAIESWGAEPVLAGVSSLSEDAVADLVAQHVIVQKDLALAIASAFQIAGAQGRTV